MNVDKLMRDIKQEILQRRPQKVGTVEDRGEDTSSRVTRRWMPTRGRPGYKSAYVLADFVILDDVDFVETAYEVLLGRPSDPEGLRAAVDDLRNGVRGKVQILGDIRFSEEGMARCVHVDGLLLPYRMQQAFKMRFIGRPLSWLVAIVRLPTLLRRLEQAQHRHAHELLSLGRHINEASADLERLIDEVRNALDGMKLDLEARLARSDASLAASEARQVKTSGELEARIVRSDASLAALGVRVAEFGASLAASEARQVKASGELEARVARSDASLAALETRQTKTVGELEARIKEIAEGQGASFSGLMDELDRRAVQSSEFMARLSSLEAGQRRILDIDLLWLREEVQRGAAGVSRVAQLATDAKRMSIDVERRVARELIGGTSAAIEIKPQVPVPADTGSIIQRNALYASLEDNFRGSREDIKQRSLHYMDLVRRTLEVTGPGDVIDLGCGRGEWLEVLREHDLHGTGVDLNEVLLDECKERGLDAVRDDALTYLSRLPDDSVVIITSMHLVEHLQFDMLVSILDEARRVLKPGGAIALETPNCENLLMSSHWFYLDPTHRNPIPPMLLSWLVGNRGFVDVEVERLTQNRGVQNAESLSDEVPGATQLNQLLGLLQASPDYAVVGRKAA